MVDDSIKGIRKVIVLTAIHQKLFFERPGMYFLDKNGLDTY